MFTDNYKSEVSSYHLEAFARGKIGELLTVEKVGENYDEQEESCDLPPSGVT